MEKADLVFLPTPGMGHLLSAIEFAKRVIDRDHRISFTILIIRLPLGFEAIDTYVDIQSSAAEHNTRRLTFVNLPTLPNPPDPAIQNLITTCFELHKPLVKQAILDRVESGSSPMPAAFILDLFGSSMIDVANELGVPSYIFFTSGCNFLSLMFHYQSLAHDYGVDLQDEFGDPEKEYLLPGFEIPVPGKIVPEMLIDKFKGMSQRTLNHAKKYRESKGILVNTFAELESHTIQSLLDQAQNGKIPRVYPVGPILELDNQSRNGSSSSSYAEKQESIMKWLDQHPPSSVVFLCFGSMGTLDATQVKEIAVALERSGHGFLWSLRKPPPEGEGGVPSQEEIFMEALPEGFLERTSDLGKVIAWAPQVAILGHRAIGGFVSHCGWNSTLESLWFGVPMATWPLYAEQQLNAFKMAKELGVGVEIRMDYNKGRHWRTTRKGNFVVTAEEIENGVKKLMSLDEEKRCKLRTMSEKARKALQQGGSSHQCLGSLIQDIFSNVA